jgi:hypothetical protein
LANSGYLISTGAAPRNVDAASTVKIFITSSNSFDNFF